MRLPLLTMLLLLAGASYELASAAAPGAGLPAPVAHWTFDQLSPDGKTLANKVSGGPGAAVTGDVRMVTGTLERGVELLGPKSVIRLGDLKLRAPATISFWFKTRDMFSDRVLLAPVAGADAKAGALRFDGGQLEIWDGKQWRMLVRRGIRTDRWQHVAVVFDGQKATGYLTAIADQSVPCACDLSGVETAIGTRLFGKLGNPYLGYLDDLRIYNVALSAKQIAAVRSPTK